jgi:hypothetical protein
MLVPNIIPIPNITQIPNVELVLYYNNPQTIWHNGHKVHDNPSSKVGYNNFYKLDPNNHNNIVTNGVLWGIPNRVGQ